MACRLPPACRRHGMTSGNDAKVVYLGQKQDNGGSSETSSKCAFIIVCVGINRIWFLCSQSPFNDGFALAFLSDGIRTPKVTGRPFQHNVKFYCISNLLKTQHNWPPLSEETTGQKKKKILLPIKRAQLFHSVHHMEISGVEIKFWGVGLREGVQSNCAFLTGPFSKRSSHCSRHLRQRYLTE